MFWFDFTTLQKCDIKKHNDHTHSNIKLCVLTILIRKVENWFVQKIPGLNKDTNNNSQLNEHLLENEKYYEL